MSRRLAVSITDKAILEQSRTTRCAGAARTDEPVTTVARRIHHTGYRLILATTPGTTPRLGLRAAGASNLISARIGLNPDQPDQFFRTLIDGRPPERLIHIDSDDERVWMALELGIRAIHLHPSTVLARPLPHGAAQARSLTDLPRLLIKLTMTDLTEPADTRAGTRPPKARPPSDHHRARPSTAFEN